MQAPVSVRPDDDLRTGGKKIKDTVGNPVGVGLSQELDTNMAMRAVLWSFGGSEQDAVVFCGSIGACARNGISYAASRRTPWVTSPAPWASAAIR